MSNINLNLEALSRYNCCYITFFVSNMEDKCITNMRVWQYLHSAIVRCSSLQLKYHDVQDRQAECRL